MGLELVDADLAAKRLRAERWEERWPVSRPVLYAWFITGGLLGVYLGVTRGYPWEWFF